MTGAIKNDILLAAVPVQILVHPTTGTVEQSSFGITIVMFGFIVVYEARKVRLARMPKVDIEQLLVRHHVKERGESFAMITIPTNTR